MKRALMIRGLPTLAVVLCLLSFTAAAAVSPFLETYCYDCHGDGSSKGGIILDQWPDDTAMLSDKPLWERIQKVVFHQEMPPKKQPQPTADERDQLLNWIDTVIFQVDCSKPDPGRVTLRRLNRVEYNNTIRDLLGIDLDLAGDFPVDDSGHGFDNIGDALSFPPVLMEKYLLAAQRALNAALGLHRSKESPTRRYSIDALEVGYNARQQGDGWVYLNSVEEDDVAIAIDVPIGGEYVVRARAWAEQKSDRPMELTFMRNQWPVQMVTVETNRDASRIYEARITAPPGRHRFRAAIRRLKDGLSEEEALRWKTGPGQQGAVYLHWLEVVRPPDDRVTPLYARWFMPLPPENQRDAAATAILTDFARKAFRRPVTESEIERLIRLSRGAWNDGMPYEEGVELALQAVLVSPQFLFRGELQPEPDNPHAIHLIDEHALASRLSFFLWSTMPDGELSAHADNGTLRRNLDEQVRRMLRDSRAQALVDNFAGQWLQLRNLDRITFDPERFKRFTPELRDAMRRETELLFHHVMVEDRSILEWLTADYSFVNEPLAKLYGVEGVTSEDGFKKIPLGGTHRRGILTHASILALTSNPTRTSPVKRGKWVLENLLNAPPPPPPPGVPELPEGRELKGSLRERMEQHRNNPLCASCHQRMDAIGFGLENFDAIGRWRDEDGADPIDPSGELGPDKLFAGPEELIDLIAQDQRDQYIRCVTDKLLTYALGRGTEYYDKCAINTICEQLSARDYRFSALVLEIIRSVPFQYRRGDNTFFDRERAQENLDG